mmetsp:Transcript_13477/g.26677  ORF Transcript_13477/g.26677 Transcript_13477/m.26677 type:complete len:202 (+) Transcript_13477:246-851(+)
MSKKRREGKGILEAQICLVSLSVSLFLFSAAVSPFPSTGVVSSSSSQFDRAPACLPHSLCSCERTQRRQEGRRGGSIFLASFTSSSCIRSLACACSVQEGKQELFSSLLFSNLCVEEGRRGGEGKRKLNAFLYAYMASRSCLFDCPVFLRPSSDSFSSFVALSLFPSIRLSSLFEPSTKLFSPSPFSSPLLSHSPSPYSTH